MYYELYNNMQSQLQKAISLTKKTGDKLIIHDTSKPDDTYVIMSLDQYENMVEERSEVRGLTEDELIDKINRDVAIWKSDQNQNLYFEKNSDFFVNQESQNITTKNKKYNFSEVDEMIKDKKNLWGIPKKRKQAAEEIIEEDRQYLEDLN